MTLFHRIVRILGDNAGELEASKSRNLTSLLPDLSLAP